MSIRNLDVMFAPKSVVLIGASEHDHSVGKVLLLNLASAGFSGPVWAVNPNGGGFGGFDFFRDVASLPGVPDLAIIASPPQTIPGLIDELGRKGTRAAIIITAGFSELGAEGRALQMKILEAAQPFLMRIVGPNCLGIMVPGIGLNAAFTHIAPLAGDIAFVSQSGAIVTAIIDWATTRKIGFSHVVSLGTMADVDFGDMLDYLAQDTNTRGILLYIESIPDARKFMSAGRQAARLKPVIVIKAGRHREGAKAAASHTGALAGSDAVYHAAFRRAGMLRVFGMEELFDATETLSTRPERKPLAGDRLTILTNGGGVGVLATDFLIDAGAHLAELATETVARLDAVLPRTWSHGNPVDIVGDATAERYARSMEILLEDPNTDAILAMNCPTAVVDNVEAAQAVIMAAKNSSKPVFTAWLGDQGAQAARQLFQNEKVPTYDGGLPAVHGFMHRVHFMRNQKLLMEIPPAAPEWPESNRAEARRHIERALAEKRDWLSEPEAKAVLKAYGIPIVETLTVPDIEQAVVKARELGFPVVLKILSEQITHKTDVGGVALGLEDEAAVRAAATTMLKKVGELRPDAVIDGFTIQRLVNRPGAFELILGLVEDPTFGPVILFGQGGTAVEIIDDKAMALPPLNLTLAEDLIRQTRVSKLLEGYRGRPSANFDAIVGALLALGDLAADLPEVVELDINPLLADQNGIIALDGRIRVKEAKLAGTRRFAIRPYPLRLESALEDRNGKSYPLRPIRPEDAPLIDDLLAHTDPEDLRMRFLSPLRRLPRQLAARLTQIDYDREMAFVLFSDDTQEHAAAVGRLSEDPDRIRAEYAILVRTDHQGLGLGYALMLKLINYARERGLKEIFGHVLRENRHMIDLCDALGFERHMLEGEMSVVEMRLMLDK